MDQITYRGEPMNSIADIKRAPHHGLCRRRPRSLWGRLKRIALTAFTRHRRYGRRRDDRLAFLVSWHDPRFFYLSLGVLVLSAMDAILTLHILRLGGVEVNPVMDYLIHTDIQLFVGVKMALTGAALVVLVAQAQFRFLNRWRVEWLLRALLPAYLCLITYEVALISRALSG